MTTMLEPSRKLTGPRVTAAMTLLSTVLAAKYAAAGTPPAPAEVALPTGSAYFEPNIGQAARSVRFLSRGASQNLAITEDGLWFHEAGGPRVQVELVGATKLAATGTDRLAGTSNYRVGSDPRRWQSEVPHFGRLVARGVYPGIDLMTYAHGRDLEYDLVVAPERDPRVIGWRFPGARAVTLGAEGDLLIDTPSGRITHGRPVAYQMDLGPHGSHQPVAARYRLQSDGTVGIELGNYDKRRPLVIDPVLSTTKRFGGSGNEQVTDIAVDGSGNVYATGFAEGRGFPTLNGAQTTIRGDVDAFVSKFNSSGTLVYSTFYGGDGEDVGRAIAVDSGGRAYVVGTTKSSNLTLARAFQTSRPPGTASFLLVLSAAGNSIAYASYLGGSSASADVRAWDVGVGSDGHMWLTGQTTATTFPFAIHGFQTTHGGGTYDAFVMRVNPGGSGTSAIVGFSYFGGTGDDFGRKLLRRGTDFVVGGDTGSYNIGFGTTFGSKGASDAFAITVTSGFSYGGGARIGGTGNEKLGGLALDGSGNLYVSGETVSDNLPVTGMATQRTFAASPQTEAERPDIFVAKMNPNATSLLYLTYLGGTNTDWNSDLAVTSSGTAYVTGATFSSDFPTTPAMATPALRNGFLTKLDTNGARLYSSLLGGSSADDSVAAAIAGSNLWVGGTSVSSSFPGASAPLGNWDALLTKLTIP